MKTAPEIAIMRLVLPELAAEEELTLMARHHAGDRRASEHIIRSHLYIVGSTARCYARNGLDIDDLASEGALGLQDALNRFDEAKGVRYNAYARWWVRAYIQRYAWNHKRFSGGKSSAMRRLMKTFAKTEEKDPTALAALANTSVPLAEVALFVVQANVVSFDAAIGDEDGPSLGSQTAGDAPLPDEQLQMAMEAAELRTLVDQLPPRQRTVIEERYFGENDVTLQDVGAMLGVGRERARQIEARALEILRDKMTGKAEAARCRHCKLRGHRPHECRFKNTDVLAEAAE